MVQKIAVGATQTVIVEILDNRNSQITRGGIDGRRQCGENVVDDPHVVAIAPLLLLQIAEDLAIVVSLLREKHLADDAGLQQLA